MANKGTSNGILDRVLGFFAYIFVSVKRLFSGSGRKTPSEINTNRKTFGQVRRTSKIVADSTASPSMSDAHRTHRSASASRSVTTSARSGRKVYFSGNEQKLKTIITSVSFSVILVIGIILLIAALTRGNGAAKIKTPVVTASGSDSVSGTDCAATITFGGCIKMNGDIISGAKTETGYDFTEYFSDLDAVFTSDINIVDLVGLVDANGKNIGIDGYPKGNYPAELAQALSDIGINYVSAANSGSLRYGFDALTDSVKKLSSNDITALGVHTDSKSAAGVIVKEVNGIKIGLASYYCPNENNYKACIKQAKNASATDAELEYAVDQAPITKIKDIILDDVELMNSSGAEVIFVMLNWGYDSSQKYTDDGRNSLAQDLIDAGVDVVIGTGPDYSQKITNKTQPKKKERSYVFYSLGNLISDVDSGKTAAKYYSMAVTFKLERKSDETHAAIAKVTTHPIYNCRDIKDSSGNMLYRYKVFPAVKYYSSGNRPEFFSDAQWKSCKKAFDSISSFASNSNITTGTYASLYGGRDDDSSPDSGVSITI